MELRDITSLISVCVTLLSAAYFLGAFRNAYATKTELAELKEKLMNHVSTSIGRAEFDKKFDDINSKLDEVKTHILTLLAKGGK